MDEPTKRGKVVCDIEGDLWERRNKGWWHCVGDGARLKWADLQARFGPVGTSARTDAREEFIYASRYGRPRPIEEHF